MKKTILEIYALAVCFATIVCTTITLGIVAWSALEIAKPDFTINGYFYENYRDNDSFRHRMPGCAGPRDAAPPGMPGEAHLQGWNSGEGTSVAASDNSEQCDRYTEAEITVRREAELAKLLGREQREGWQTLVKCLLALLVNLLVFIPHWLLGKRARMTSGA
ncbi:MAG: hypothetical protein ABL934_08340 [Lysobacteraceae bacterium]